MLQRRITTTETNGIKTGEITEQELVSLFGSESQKKSYKSNGHFIGSNKQTLLKNVSKYCKIKDCGRRIYRITEVYSYPLPSNFAKMNKSLYRYIIPLLLSCLTDWHDENNKPDMGLSRWARKIGMVNRNFNLIKYNQESTSQEIGIPVAVINDFFDKSENMAEWYINNAFGYLESAGLIACNGIYHASKEISDGRTKIDENGKVYTGISLDRHMASEEETRYYFQCVNVADTVAGIENTKERYYSKKSDRFNSALKKELYKEKIKCIYKTYEVSCTDIEKCRFVLGQFGETSYDCLTTGLNKEFTAIVMENAEKRFDAGPGKYRCCKCKDDYMVYFGWLCEMVIDKNTEYLGNRIKKKKFEDGYSLHITPERNGK